MIFFPSNRNVVSLRPKYETHDTMQRPEPPAELRRDEEPSLADLISVIERKNNAQSETVSGTITMAPPKQKPTKRQQNSFPQQNEHVMKEPEGARPDKVASSGHVLQHTAGNSSNYMYGYRAMSPIYDYQTKNTSFLKVHEQLEMLGVRNNEFFLLLLNPRLQGVDPHDPNISPELALMVIEECQLNFFYYLREVVRIPQQGAGVVSFELDRATLAAAYCFINDINHYLIKPRQTGKSVGISAFLSWAFKFGVTNGGFAFYANKEKNSKANLKRMKTYIGLLPKYLADAGAEMRDTSGNRIRRINNIKRYYEPGSGNTADVMNCAISEETADELGRGDTHNFEFYDEAEFMNYIETTVGVSGPAFNTASYNALKNGMHSCRIFATTPGDLSNEKKCGSAMKLVNDAVVWEERFYDVDPLDFKRHIAKKSNYRIVYIEYSYQKLGLTEAWFVRACANVGNNISKIRREILLQRFAGNNASPFSEEDITELDENKERPKHVIKFGKGGFYEIKFYLKPEELRKNRVYFLGLDPSDGTGSDNYALTVIDPYTFKTVIEFKNQLMSPQGCRELLEYLLRKYIPKTIICVESNRNGTTIIDYLKESKILKSRIYASSEASMDTLLVKEEYDNIGFLKDQLMRRKFYGVKTTTTTRQMMMNILVDSVKFRKDILTAENLVEDIKDLVLMNGTIKAASGKHDDCVMSWCIAMYAFYFGEKLERYGFKKGELPDDMVEDEEFQKLEELYKNPYIRQHFPSFTVMYENVVRGKLKREFEEKKSATLQNMADNDVGSILKDIVKADPEYGKSQAYDTPQVNEQTSSLKDRWARMNQKRNNNGYGPYGNRKRNDEDDGWF